MNSNLYITIPSDVVLNFQKRKHREDKFKTLYFYKEKQRFKLNRNKITEIDIYNMKEIQRDTLYKSSFKSSRDKFYNWYYCLKPEYNECESIYIENENGYTKKNKKKYELNKSKKTQFTDIIPIEKNKKTKYVITF
jgi:hypothetical protein